MKFSKVIIRSSLIAVMLVSTSSFAESVTMPISEQSNQQVDTPRNGQAKAKVESVYGEPLQRVSAVGEPPISKWVYQEFTVYFENDLVLHAVKHRS